MALSSYIPLPSPIKRLLLSPVSPYVSRRTIAFVVVFTLYLVTAQAGSYLYSEIGTSPSLIWLPVGIALAAIVIEGYWIWPAIALASLTSGLMSHGPLLLVFASMLGNTAQPLIGGGILRRLNFDPLLSSSKDMFSIIAVSFAATVIVPTVTVGASILYNEIFQLSRPLPSWLAMWVGGSLSALVLTPFLARWLYTRMTPRSWMQHLEIAASLLGVVGTSYLVFATPYATIGGVSLLLVLIAALFWVAFRVGPRFMTLALLLMTGISLAGALYGTHAPTASTSTLGQRLFNTEIFDLLLAFFFFILVSVEEQRKEAIKKVNSDAHRLEDAFTKIQGEEKAKNEFITTLAHELRNPLAPLRSGIEYLRLTEGDGSNKDILTTMEGQVRTMGRLLDDLLDISRITQGKLTLRTETIELQSALNHAIASVRLFAEKKSQNIQVAAIDHPLFISADPVRIEQIIINVLNNASKYTPPSGTIWISCADEGNLAVVRIKDTGMGIPQGMLSRIFEPFMQAHTAGRSTPASGLGIGLALTKNLVELHGGTITAASAGVGSGSEFTIRFPRVPALPSEPPPVREGKLPASTRILIVDDNAQAAESLGRLLSMRGHQVSAVHDGASALAASDYDVMLLDIGLPDIDGYDIARMLRGRGDKRVLVALSGYGQREDKERAKDAGFDRHLTKPVGFSDIESTLAELMR